VIVVDASAIIELLLNTTAGERVTDRLLDVHETVTAPHLLDVEVLQVLRRFSRSRDLDAERGQQALEDFADLPIVRYPHEPFIARIWELRNNVTAYDAAYVALAEALNCALLTRDRKLARSSGHRAKVELL